MLPFKDSVIMITVRPIFSWIYSIDSPLIPPENSTEAQMNWTIVYSQMNRTAIAQLHGILYTS